MPKSRGGIMREIYDASELRDVSGYIVQRLDKQSR